MTKTGKTKKLILAIILLAACVACFVLLFLRFGPKAEKGSKAYVLEVKGIEKSAKYEGRTDAEFLSGLMDELQEKKDFSYRGTGSDYGLYITAVNGEEANDADKTYWAIYVNGEYGMYGADSQPVSDGDTFILALESYE